MVSLFVHLPQQYIRTSYEMHCGGAGRALWQLHEPYTSLVVQIKPVVVAQHATIVIIVSPPPRSPFMFFADLNFKYTLRVVGEHHRHLYTRVVTIISGFHEHVAVHILAQPCSCSYPFRRQNRVRKFTHIFVPAYGGGSDKVTDRFSHISLADDPCLYWRICLGRV